MLINWTLISDSLWVHYVTTACFALFLCIYYIVRLLACNFDVINLKAFAVGICNCVFSHVFICVCVCICFHIQQNCKVHSQFWLSSKAFLSAWKTHLNWSELSWFVDHTISVHLLPQLSSFSSSFLFSCFL